MRYQGVLPLVLVLATAALAGLLPASAAAKPPGDEPCAKQKSFGWMGDWEVDKVTIPSLTNPNGVQNYDGLIRRPRNTIAFPGKRPVVLLQHGLGGNECSLSWIARDLAGHGYVTMTWRSPKENESGKSLANAIDATRSGVSFARGPENPFLSVTDTTRTALGGHAMGATVASGLQGEAALGIDAVIALDNLVRVTIGDPGAATNDCDDTPFGQVTPTAPAIGFASDTPCKARQDYRPQTLKQPGFLHWREAKVPAMDLVMAGFTPGDFGAGGTKSQYKKLSHYTRAWLWRYVFDDKDAVQQLLIKEVEGQPTQNLLSTQFFSAAYLPGVVTTTNFRDYVQRDHSIPDTKKTGGPDKGQKVDRRKLARVGIRFRFRADEPGARFECRLDKQRWRDCTPPKKLEQRLPKGRHSFRARAIDAAGNKETKPAHWKFRVVG